jgi:hypothetical protein
VNVTDETPKTTLEESIGEWRAYLRRRKAIHKVDIEELEDHLRSQIHGLVDVGLSDEEAFLVAVKRIGDLDALSREFAREYSERLWKQLVISPEAGSTADGRKEAIVAVALAIASAVAIKLPELFGFHMRAPITDTSFYVRNFSLFVLPLLAGYFAWKRAVGRAGRIWLAIPFVVAVLAVNIFPFSGKGSTLILAAIHLPIALWLTVGYAYIGGRLNDHYRRMDFVRFSGEWFIYYILIALGGGVLIAFTMFIFQAIGVDAEELVAAWVMPCGVVGAVVISAWLVEAKKSVIENIAPVLTRLFTPLFTVVLLAFLATMVWTGSAINVEREVLIGFDLLLVLVLGLLLYSISARDPQSKPGIFDVLQLVLVVSALLVDAVALWAITARISESGFSPNKVAALGENLVLLVNLGWSTVLYARFLAGQGSFTSLERWQTSYLQVFAVWAWLVVLVFPPLFGYR